MTLSTTIRHLASTWDDRDRKLEKRRRTYPSARPDVRDLVYKAGGSGDSVWVSVTNKATGDHVGSVSAELHLKLHPRELDSFDLKRYDFLQELPSDIEVECRRDFVNLVRAVGKPLALYAVTSTYIDRKYRGQGVGGRAYYELIKYLAPGAALAPNTCSEGAGATSNMAMGVWNTMAKKYPVMMVGRVAYHR